MSVNGLVVFAAIAVTSMGIIARACKDPGVLETQKTSVTPNGSVLNNTAAGVRPNAELSRKLVRAFSAA
ncbi:MAG: hypothetical protein ACKO3R_09135 [bacterium]